MYLYDFLALGYEALVAELGHDVRHVQEVVWRLTIRGRNEVVWRRAIRGRDGNRRAGCNYGQKQDFNQIERSLF
jgi:hypothetical protein